jgi:hypothetical protein
MYSQTCHLFVVKIEGDYNQAKNVSTIGWIFGVTYVYADHYCKFVIEGESKQPSFKQVFLRDGAIYVVDLNEAAPK